jgi:hypothetical protein
VLLELGIHPVLIALLLSCGYGASRLAGLNLPHEPMFASAAIALVASELAIIPLILTRQASQATIAQSALVATVLHMFISIGLAVVVSFKLLPGQPFLFWMCGFYWMTLMSVATVAIRSVRRASPALPARASTI